jgi:hypothetical protein
MPNGLALAVVLLILMLFFAYGISLFLNFLTPFYTTPKKILKRLIPMFKLERNQTFADLGSGDGRVLFQTYKEYKCKCSGYEISPVLLIYFKLRKFLTHPFNSKIELKEESFFKADLSEYDTIYCCLPTDLLEILETKFKKELKEGSNVFTYKNPLPTKKGKEILIEGEKVYQYTF